MRTLREHLEDQFTANVVRRELEAENSIYLIQNQRTGETAVTAQTKLFSDEFTKCVGGGIISGNEGGMGGDKFSTPIDEIDFNSDWEKTLKDFAEVEIEEVETDEENENFLIVDNTANTGAIYIGIDDENCQLEENAKVYATEKEANQVIIDNGWEEWAGVIGTNYPVNS